MAGIYPAGQLAAAQNSFSRHVEAGRVSKANAAILLEFLQDYGLQKNLSDRTIAKYLYDYSAILELTDADLPTINLAEMKELARAIAKKPKCSERSKQNYIKVLKTFYGWLWKVKHKRKGPENLEEVFEWLSDYTYKVDKKRESEPVFMTEEDVRRLLSASEDIRRKVLFAMIWSTGGRIGELLTLQLQDVEPYEHGFKVHIRESKTVRRTVPVVDEKTVACCRYIRIWLQHHPRKDEPSSPFFLNERDQLLTYRNAHKWLRNAAKLSGLKKRVHFHAFRKGRSTNLANHGWGNAQICTMQGWAVNSPVVAVYVRRAGVDVARKMEEMHGLVKGESEEESTTECPGCQAQNNPGAEYCSFCSRPLSREVIEKRQREERELLKTLFREKYADLIEEVRREVQNAQSPTKRST